MSDRRRGRSPQGAAGAAPPPALERGGAAPDPDVLASVQGVAQAGVADRAGGADRQRSLGRAARRRKEELRVGLGAQALVPPASVADEARLVLGVGCGTVVAVRVALGRRVRVVMRGLRDAGWDRV